MYFINIENDNKESSKIEIDELDDVKNVKRKISEKTGYPMNEVHIFDYSGFKMDDASVLEDYKFGDSNIRIAFSKLHIEDHVWSRIWKSRNWDDRYKSLLKEKKTH